VLSNEVDAATGCLRVEKCGGEGLRRSMATAEGDVKISKSNSSQDKSAEMQMIVQVSGRGSRWGRRRRAIIVCRERGFKAKSI